MQAESDSARAAIEQMAARFAEHFSAGRADSMAAMYSEDAHVMPPNMAEVSGRAGVQQMLQAFMSQMPGTRLSLHVASVTANGPMAVARGHWRMSTPEGTPVDSGVYMERWRRSDGQWMLVDDIWNSSAPLPPPPPARRR
ncbi:MAG TPA: nuclear transport factor 2 family protein [Gemmatimonadales bacterium]|nr:nuclear transport factor 2 family protein [Gemmatimonadales bacterium]